jgi:multiple sugar transport system permease protein
MNLKKVNYENIERKSESLTAYLMILPAVLIIVVISLWPVINSFWNSLFDLRLNHPVKNKVTLEYKIDLERFADTQYYIKSTFRQIRASEGLNSDPQKIDAIQADLDSIKEELISQPGVPDKYSQVEAILNDMKPVTDDGIRYAVVDSDFAERYLADVEQVRSSLTGLSLKKDDAADQAAALMEELRISILKPNYIGLDNYKHFAGELTVKDGEPGRLAKALLNTLFITIVSVCFELVLGLITALIINRPYRGRGLTRASVLVPWAIPTVVSARMWAFLYDGQTGIFSHWLTQLGIIKDAGILLTTKEGAFFSVIFADVWKTTPYLALLLLAGLQGISQDLYEASNIDGASRLQQFFKITLPLLKPTIIVSVLFRTLDAFRIFDLIFVLTGGGPGNSTESISMYAYVTMFSQMDFGKGSTLSIIVFLCVALISIIFIKLLGADVMGNRLEERG